MSKPPSNAKRHASAATPPPRRSASNRTAALQVTKRSYEAFLRSVSAEDLAALCEEAAQEMGFTDINHVPRRRCKHVLYRAYEIHADRQSVKRHYRNLEIANRRRARQRGSQTERIDRAAIIARDNSTCYLCGKTCEPHEIHLDHVIPLAKGGPHSADNLRVTCAPCNIRKGASLPSTPFATLTPPDSVRGQ